jgi:DNA modification methylase
MGYTEEFKSTPEYKAILESNRKRYEKNKEKRKRQMNQYYNSNKKKLSEYKKKYYTNNKETILKKRKDYVSANPEKIKAWAEENPDKIKSYGKSKRFKKYRLNYEKERRSKDFEFWLKKTLRRRLNYILKKKLGIERLPSRKYGIDFKAIAEHLGPCPGFRSEWHVDHIVPLSKFDFRNPEDVRKAFAPENHQWLLAKDNLEKQDTLLEEWNAKKQKQKPYLQRDILDTTFSSLWMFRNNNKEGNQFGNIVFKDPIANIKGITTVRTRDGINYFSKFNPIIADNIISYWSNKGDIILDPFAGRTRAIIASAKERKYFGFEIAKPVYDVALKAIDENKDKLSFLPIIYNEDSFNLDKSEYNHILADLIFTCPPYWNIEKYPSSEGQLSDINNYDSFLLRLKSIMEKSCWHLKQGGYAVIVAGDFRIKGRLISFHNDVINVMKEIKMNPHDIIINQTVTYNRATQRFGACKKTKITSKVHEYILVFKKL